MRRSCSRSLFAVLAFFATSNGLVDYQTPPLGTDSQRYAAGKYVLEGKPAAPFSPPLHTKKRNRSSAPTRRSTAGIIRRSFSPRGGAGAAAYFAALAAWQLATLALYLWTAHAITRDPRAFLPALAFPPSSSTSPTARTDS